MHTPLVPSAQEEFAGHDEQEYFEYMEFKNVGTTPFDLKGVVISFAVDFTFPGTYSYSVHH